MNDFIKALEHANYLITERGETEVIINLIKYHFPIPVFLRVAKEHLDYNYRFDFGKDILIVKR